MIIDARYKGSKARFINHSCNPNCQASWIKSAKGNQIVTINAIKPINNGDELTYNYKFNLKDKNVLEHC